MTERRNNDFNSYRSRKRQDGPSILAEDLPGAKPRIRFEGRNRGGEVAQQAEEDIITIHKTEGEPIKFDTDGNRQ